MLKIPEPYRDLARTARRQGWIITYSGSGHLKWRSPGGATVTTGSTPKRTGHGTANARRRLRKAGLG